MKKIDLHIHTIATICDPANFAFDIDELESYVEHSRLDAIAITNHNLFDRDNYREVSSKLSCAVFPGIEINVTTPGKYGHVIVVAPPEDVDRFTEGAQAISEACPSKDSHVDWQFVINAFCNLSEYLVIPHYLKKKKLDLQTIEELRKSTGFDALEVSNNKTWLRENDKTPEPLVVFSDARPGFQLDEECERPKGAIYAYGYTYINAGDATVPSIKLAFRDSKNVSVFRKDNEFEILPEGLPVSRRLNVVIGERSSGKTFTLKRIIDSLEPSDCFHLEQFHIAKNADEKTFNESVAAEDSRFFDDYFDPFKTLIMKHLEDDPEPTEKDIGKFCEALIKYANSPTNKASDTTIFSSTQYDLEICATEMSKDVELIEAIKELRDSTRHVELIRKYIPLETATELYYELRTALFEVFRERQFKDRANAIINGIKTALANLSSRKPLPDTNCLKDYLRYSFRLSKTAEAFNKLLPNKELDAEEDGKYKKLRTRMQHTSATEARKGLKLPKDTDVSGLLKAASAREKLQVIRGFDSDVYDVICRIVFKIDSRIVLNDGTNTNLSGGQRAEYLLLHLLSTAENKDYILLDEPESSFDNPFLNKEVCTLINRIAEHATVFLVTHNNTLGVSIHPDWIIYTEKESTGAYKVYSGSLNAENLLSTSGEVVSRPENLLNILEAGIDTYEDRREYYGLK